MGELLSKAIHFLRYDIWRIRLSNLPRGKSLAIQLLRILLLTFREFDKDKCQLRASALTFFSLLSIIPVAAMIFSIGKGFVSEERLRDAIRERFTSSFQLQEQDVIDPAGLAARLKRADDPLTAHLADRLSPGTRTLLSEAAPAPRELAGAVTKDLNAQLRDPALAADGRFTSESWTLEMQRLGAGPYEDASQQLYFNRLLLAAALPEHLPPPAAIELATNQIVEKIIEFSSNLLANTQGGLIAGVGVIILFWAVIKMMRTIEHSLNEIWGVRKQRSFRRIVSNYLSVMFVFPVLLIMFPALSQSAHAGIDVLVERYEFLGVVQSLFFLLMRLTPFLVIWLLLTLIYLLMPNTRVRWLSAALAGLVAGVIYMLLQWALLRLGVGVARNNEIYGSFLAFPLLLIWMQASWTVVLFGAEFCFAHQHVGTYEYEHDVRSISHSYKRLLSLRVVKLLIDAFCRGDKPAGASELAHELHLPLRLVQDILFELTEAGVLAEMRGEKDQDAAYQPARDVADLTVKFAIDALENRGSANIPVAPSVELERLSGSLEQFGQALEASPGNVLLKDL